jgi:hypothetical protein
MNAIDQYPQTVLWSEEDKAYVGYCLSVFRGGGVCHGDDPVEVLKELRGLVEEELGRLRTEGKPWPLPVGLPEPRQTIGALAA